MAGKEDQIKTEIAVDGEQEYKKACKEIDASLKAIASEMKVVSATFEGNADSIEAMTAKQDVLNKRLEEQKKKVAEAEAALKKYQDAGQGTSEAAKKMETNLNYARAAMIKTENEIRNLDAGLEEARNASNDFSDGLEDISQEAESTGGALDGLGGKVSSVAGALGKGLKTIGVGVAAIGTAMVAGIGYAVGFADEVKGAMNDFEASTGIAEAAANGFEDAMLRIYNNNFGENMDDIAASMATVAQTSGEVDPTKIEELTQNALMLRDTFGFDIQEQMRAVNMLMDQFGLSGEEAFNLIAQGAQNGLDKNGDLLDSINEYSVHFKSLGLDAEDMFNSFANGADAGTFSVDKLGDAVKEFGIRVKDGSDGTMQAFKDVPPSKEGVSRPLLSTAGTNTGLPIPEHCPRVWPRLHTARRFFDMTDFEKVYNFENLYRAYRKARRGKRWKGAAAKFEVNLLEALNLLSVQLQSHTYRLSPYNTFKVYEPKERVVMSNSYKDKVVQHTTSRPPERR